ncbi:MAG: PAS domain S-box protein [Magnetococcales bacterium]|nr:PAS domain S-box protein [Magnetococcales bacterium]
MAEAEPTISRLLRPGIGRHMAIWILIFSSLITLLITAIQLRMDYERDVSLIHARLSEIRSIHLESILNSLWLANHDLVRIHLEGLMRLPDMQYIAVDLEDGGRIAAGRPSEEHLIRLEIPLHYHYRQEEVPLGTLRAAATLEGVYHRLMDKVSVILVSQGIKTFLVSLFILALFYRLVGGRLQAFAAHTRSLTLKDDPLPFHFTGRAKHLESLDELDQLAAAFNESWSRQRADFQKLRETEQELLHLRNLLANVIDSMPSVLIGVDLEGRVIQWNRKAAENVGLPSTEALGRPLSEVYPLLSGQMERIQQALVKRTGLREEKIVWRVNDEIRFSDVTIYPLVTNGTEGAVIRVDDITERVRIEEMMIQAEKMLSVGGLAAGMAHEINNPLAGILVNVQVINQRLMDGSPKNRRIAEQCGLPFEALSRYLEQRGVVPLIQAVADSCGRAARIVENMLNFSRKGGVDAAPQNLAHLLDQTLELAANDYDLKKHYDFRHIRIVREYDPATPPALCVGNNIQQVFLNILKNGAQAMAHSDAGILDPCFTLRVRPDGRMVRVEIADNGPGMDEAVRKRVFEPFFTTKEVGSGTGLGLSISYFIITENHMGTLEVDSKPGQGATLILCLPMEEKIP